MAEARVVPSVCPLDCPDRCSLDVTVRDNRIVTIDGSNRYDFTEGYICGKVRKFGDRVHGPKRLLTPAVRVGPKGPGARFEPVSWDEAIGLVATRFRKEADEHGWEAIWPYWYGGSNGWLTGGGLDQRLWNLLGTSRNHRTLCATNSRAGAKGVYGDLPSADPMDVDQANLAIVWGFNPSASGIHWVPRVRALKKRGGTLVVVDPRQTPLAKAADLHLAPLPGTDVGLALAVAHVAFEKGLVDRAFASRWCDDLDEYQAIAAEWPTSRAAAVCGVREADIESLAHHYATVRPALLRLGWGLERTRNGTDATRAALALPLLFGAFGQRGDGFVLSTSDGYGVESASWQGKPATTRLLNMTQLGLLLETLDAPPVKALYVYNCNPVATVPDQTRVARALARDDLFVVVHEQVHTDTVDYADVILPATTFLEHHELARSYGGYVVQWSPPAIAPVGAALSNHQVMQRLAAALGVDDPSLAVSEVELAKEIAAHARVPFDVLERDHIVPVPRPVQFVDAVPSGRIRLTTGLGPPTLRPPPVDADKPLLLVSPSSTRAISSTGFETLPAGTAKLSLSPVDAALRGITEGMVVRAHNAQGEMIAVAAIDATLRAGVASFPKGVWRSGTRNGYTSNALIAAHVDANGQGACYNDARIEVERVV